MTPGAGTHPGAPGPPLLSARGVHKSFRRGTRDVVAIESFSLDVAEGEFVSIVGPSGCGKTTFLHIVGGFEAASAGEVTLAGRPITGPHPERGMLFQEFSLFPWLTVERNIEWPLEVKALSRAERRTRVEHFLELVDLSAFAAHYPAELSGGMKQRVALARLLAQDPRVLLMDEPFGALDAQTRELMQEQLEAIWRQSRKTVLFVTHDIDEAVYLGTRVVLFTARPGCLKADLPVGLGWPRQIEIKKSAEYLAYRNRIWDLLREEVLKTSLDQARAAR